MYSSSASRMSKIALWKFGIATRLYSTWSSPKSLFFLMSGELSSSLLTDASLSDLSEMSAELCLPALIAFTIFICGYKNGLALETSDISL